MDTLVQAAEDAGDGQPSHGRRGRPAEPRTPGTATHAQDAEDGRDPTQGVVMVALVADISVEPRPDGTYAVEVRSRGHTTSHVVSVPAGLEHELGCDQTTQEQLVVRSFEFLLEREPATSILRRFSLEAIGDYFPEYRREIRRRCSDPAC